MKRQAWLNIGSPLTRNCCREPSALARLKAEGLIDEEGINALDADVISEVEDAYQFADQSPDPEPEMLFADVYAPVEDR